MKHKYHHIISLENLLASWCEFQKGKRNKIDVQIFERNLIENLMCLHDDLNNMIYRHGEYEAFSINDPKPRKIHKASVRDRVVHRAIYRTLYPYYDNQFIFDSYSCRKKKGIHKAIERFKYFSDKVSKNKTRSCWVLKCDIKKFFDSIDHEILIGILEKDIRNEETVWLIKKILKSFYTKNFGVGLPLGNLISQLFVNIYMNEFDQFVKHGLRFRYYIRYADDFIFLSEDKEELYFVCMQTADFLQKTLKLALHPDKVSIHNLVSGVDFLGWVRFPHHRVLRTNSRKRMVKKIEKSGFRLNTVASYLGLLKWGDAHNLTEEVNRLYERSIRLD